MGLELFSKYADLVSAAECRLGYSLRELIEDKRLHLTEYTQPALFVVNALHYLEWRRAGGQARYVAGHSLGEYNALYAAGSLSFEQGLDLVAERGRLMGQAPAGAMAAVLGWTADKLRRELDGLGATDIDLANDNGPTQQVISGPKKSIQWAAKQLCDRGATVVELRVSAAFHSRYMQEARGRFARYLRGFEVMAPRIPVVSNVTARPYDPAEIQARLAEQIAAPVRWLESVRYMVDAGVESFEELGPGQTLTKLVDRIRKAQAPIDAGPAPTETRSAWKPALQPRPSAQAGAPRAEALGSASFRRRYDLRYAYLAGAMYKGIASSDLVIRMARAGMLAFLGTGGMGLERMNAELRRIAAALGPGRCWGANLLASIDRPELEEHTVDLLIRHRVPVVEAAAFMTISPALVRYRALGLRERPGGGVEIAHRIIAKLSRPEVARAFLAPAPTKILDRLLERGAITPTQARLAARVPMADDLCIEADSGGHTDRGVMPVLLPRMMRLRDEYGRDHGYTEAIHVGAAGGIGTPEAAAAALIMGADFLLTGSINQCTVEAGTSDAVKDILTRLDVQDVTCAPAGDMFELGAEVQVVRKGTLFPARANRLYMLYQQFESLEELGPQLADQIQRRYFGRSFDEVWAETCDYYARTEPSVLERAEQSAKKKMALVFRWYFIHTNRLALAGDPSRRSDYQIHCGPALGAFNNWVRGTALEDWRARHVDEIAKLLLSETAVLLGRQLALLHTLAPTQIQPRPVQLGTS